MSEIAIQPLKLETLTMGNMSVEVVNINDEPWFYAPSLAKTLEYKDARDMLRGVEDEDKTIFSVSAPSVLNAEGVLREATFLNEAGFYSVIFRSRSEVAKPFKRWVTKEVLPSIRKTGQYKVHQEAQKLGVTLDYTDDQWEWLRYRPQFVDLIPLVLAGYDAVKISKMLPYNTKGITARKQIDRLKELGFIPQVIEPRIKRLERQIKAKLAAKQAE